MSTTDNEWAVAEFLDEKGALTLLRIRYIDPIPDLSEELKIIWEYEFDAKTGLPNEEALSKMDECEGLLTEFELEKRTCRIVAIITGEGIRQWILYSSDVGEFERFVNDSFPHAPPYPIDIEHESDPKWGEYLALAKLLDGSTQ